MNLKWLPMNKCVLVTLLAIACGASIGAGNAPVVAKPTSPSAARVKPAKVKKSEGQQKAVANTAAIVAALKQAYQLLTASDRDYKGHRHHAMRAIEAACKQLGSDIGGNDNGNKKQADSDAQLRQAKAILLKVRDEIGTAKKPGVLVHVNEAVNQLTMALSVE